MSQLFFKKHRVTRRGLITSWPSIIDREVSIKITEPKVYKLDFSDNVKKDSFE